MWECSLPKKNLFKVFILDYFFHWVYWHLPWHVVPSPGNRGPGSSLEWCCRDYRTNTLDSLSADNARMSSLKCLHAAGALTQASYGFAGALSWLISINVFPWQSLWDGQQWRLKIAEIQGPNSLVYCPTTGWIPKNWGIMEYYFQYLS